MSWALQAATAIIPRMNQALTKQRIRIQYGKFDAMRFVGHLDLAKAWERILRRADLPVEYTQGFNPRPRMQFAAALPVGITSASEYLDVWLTEELGGSFPDDWIAAITATSPRGLPTYAIHDIPIRHDALPRLVTRADYVLTPVDGVDPATLTARAEALLAQDSIPRPGRKKPYDLRPLLLDVQHTAEDELVVALKTGEHGNGRADELLDAMGYALHQVRVHRCRLYLDGSPA